MTSACGGTCDFYGRYCVECEAERSIRELASKTMAHPVDCSCQRCAIIRRDARRARRKQVIEVSVSGTGIVRA